jgi:flagellar hook-length control protein FliK
LGFDFADVMARQMQRLVPLQRQTIAADTAPEPQQEVSTSDPSADRTPATDSRPDSERPATHEARTSQADSNTSPEAANHATTDQTPRGRQDITKKTKASDTDALLASLMQGATPLATVAAAPNPAVVTAAASQTPMAWTAAGSTTAAELAHANALQTVELSPQMRIITDPKKAPSPESLAAFAKSMGLDESAIQNLLGQSPSTPANAATGATVASAGSATGLAQTPSAALQAALGTGLPSAPQVAATPADSAVASQLAAMAATTGQVATGASGAGLAAAATTLNAPAMPGLTPTDMASIQQLQITVLPAAVLPIQATAVTNAPAPSTMDMLSLVGTGVNEQDVSALLSRFSQDAGSESNPDQQPSQDDGSGNFSGFAQTLTRTSNATNPATANTASASAVHMGEVYDQLSDKMATELAARMHKQLSDGEWKMKFALRPSNLGGVEIQLEMKDGKLDAVFRADNPLTRDLLQNSSQRLREALGNFGINAGQVNVGQGGGNTSQSGSGQMRKQPQVRDNSTSQVNGTSSASGATSGRSKANASLLDLYA